MALAFLHNKRPGVAIVHEHNLVVVDSKLPTCEEDGYELHQCSCGGFFKEIIPALGHNYAYDILYSDESGHWNQCTRCGAKNNFFPHLPNIPEEEVTIGNPQVCTVCGYIMKELHPHDHVGERVLVSQPTCTEAGSWKLTCSICGEVITEEIPPLDHQWSITVVTNTPTCATSGTKTYTCDRCGETKEEVYANPIETHQIKSTITKQATCAESGEKYYWCEVCGYNTTEEIPATGNHTPIPIGAVSATCTTNGSTAGSKCSVCDTFLVEPTILPYKGHTAASGWINDYGWTTETRYHWKKCVVCGETLDETHGLCDKDGYGDLVLAANCASDEIRYKACSVCGGQYTEPVQVPNTKLQHISSSTVYHKDITETTHTYYRKCTMCGKTTVEGVRNHSWKTSEGVTYCTACGYEKTT